MADTHITVWILLNEETQNSTPNLCSEMKHALIKVKENMH